MDEAIFDFKKIKLPTYSFIVYVLLIPFESIMATQIVVMVSFATIAALITSVLVLIYLLFKPKLVRLTKTAFPWVVFFIWAAISIVWSIDKSRSVYDFIYISKHLFFLFIISSYPFNYSEKRAIRHTIILSGILLAATVFFSTFQVRGISTFVRATIANGYYKADPNQIASTLLLPIGFLIVDFVERRKFNILDAAAAVVLFFTLVYTGSRGAFAAFVILVIYLIVKYSKHRDRKKSILSLVFVIAGISLLISLTQPDILNRFAKVDNLDRYSGRRIEVWKESYNLFLDKPLAGYGFGTFKSLSKGMTKDFKTAHNNFIQSLVENGLVGGLLMFAATIPLLGFSARSSFDRAAKAGVIGVTVSSLFLYTFNYDYFWLSIILAEIANRTTQPKTPKTLPKKIATKRNIIDR